MKHTNTSIVKRDESPTAGDLSDTIANPAPAPLDRRPRGFTIGHAVGDRLPASLDGRPRGFTIGHAVGDPLPASLDGRPRGFTIGREVGTASNTEVQLRRPSRARDDRANTPTRDAERATSERAA
jgi:hypothetical protein